MSLLSDIKSSLQDNFAPSYKHKHRGLSILKAVLQPTKYNLRGLEITLLNTNTIFENTVCLLALFFSQQRALSEW